MTAPERPAPQEPTAQEHADTVRKTLDSTPHGLLIPRQHPAYAALDALVAQVERLEQERDEARAERSTLYQRGDDFAHHFWKERAAQAERERDEALAALKDEMKWDMGGVPESEWKRRAEAAEARAVQAERERDAIHRAYVEQCSYTTAANASKQRYRRALCCVFLDPLASGGARAVAREALGIPFIPFATPQEMMDAAAAATRE